MFPTHCATFAPAHIVRVDSEEASSRRVGDDDEETVAEEEEGCTSKGRVITLINLFKLRPHEHVHASQELPRSQSCHLLRAGPQSQPRDGHDCY